MISKDAVRLILTTSLSNRDIGARCNLAYNTVRRYRERLRDEELTTWDDVSKMPLDNLDARINNGRQLNKKKFVEPNWEHIFTEMHRVGVTLTLLYEEYARSSGDSYMSDREFRRRYEKYVRRKGIVMRQPLRPGEQLFVDYSGKKPWITNPKTGIKTQVELWVGVAGASRKTFAYATPSQQLPDWIEAHVLALEFLGAVTNMLVPDNLKSAVVSVTRKDGHTINPTYQDFADHYDTFVMPTRSRKPRDKAAVEAGVLLAQRWILARLRNRTFFSIEELNIAIAELLVSLNNKPMRSRGGKSRNQLFEELDLPAMKSLPGERYEYADWKIGVVVSSDYHVSWEGHYYSVPYRLISAKVDIRASKSRILIFHRGQVVASHDRSNEIGELSTVKEHMPAAHRIFDEDRVADLIKWAEMSGPNVQRFLQQHLAVHRPVASLQAFKGLKRLAREYGVERLDCACERALRMNASSITSVRSMLVRGIENSPLQEEAANEPMPSHENVRGAESYK